MTACPVNIRSHLLRGLVGLALLVAAAFAFAQSFWASVALVAVAAVFLRGCPVCWTVWFMEALREKKRHESAQNQGPPPTA